MRVLKCILCICALTAVVGCACIPDSDPQPIGLDSVTLETDFKRTEKVEISLPSELPITDAPPPSLPTATTFPEASVLITASPLPFVESVLEDQIGWITIPDTNIDYPIMYGEDYFYHYHDENGNSSEAGSIYAYYNALCRNNVIAGHNARESGTRFHELHLLQDRVHAESVNGKAVRNYDIYCSLFGLETWRIFAMYETSADESPKTLRYNIDYNCNNSVTEWITTQIERSEVDFGHQPHKQNRFLTLETCGDEYDGEDAQSRLYLFLYCLDAE